MLHAALELGFFRSYGQPFGDRAECGLRACL